MMLALWKATQTIAASPNPFPFPVSPTTHGDRSLYPRSHLSGPIFELNVFDLSMSTQSFVDLSLSDLTSVLLSSFHAAFSKSATTWESLVPTVAAKSSNMQSKYATRVKEIVLDTERWVSRLHESKSIPFKDNSTFSQRK